MKLKTIYLSLCVLGVVLPYWQFLPWVAENGLHLGLLVQQLFANRIGGVFGMGVFISFLVLLGFMRAGGTKLGIRFPSLPPPPPFSLPVSPPLPPLLFFRHF